jgi:hypothetical protein
LRDPLAAACVHVTRRPSGEMETLEKACAFSS